MPYHSFERIRVAARLAVLLLVTGSSRPCLARIDLVGALDAAETSDPIYREAQDNALAVAEQIPQARAQLWLPTLHFTAGISRVEQDITSAVNFGFGGKIAYTGKNYSVNLAQPVYHHDRIVALRQADKRLQQAQFQVLSAHQDLLLRVAQRYFDELAARDSLAFAKAETEALNSQLDQAQQRFQVGLIAITDVQEAQAGFDRAHASEISAENDIDNANEALREVTASYDLDLVPLGEQLPLIMPEPPDIDSWTEAALRNNPDVGAAQIATAIAEEEIRRQFAGHAPTLDITGSRGFIAQGGRLGSTEVDQGDIGIQINVPIYEGGQVFSRTRGAQQQHAAAVERLEQKRRAVHRETRDAYLGIMTRISSVKAYNQAVRSSQTALESTSAGFEVGTRTAVDVVAAERVLYQAKRDYSRARYDYILYTLRLKKAAGSLQPDDLTATNSWLIGSTSGAPAAAHGAPR